MKIETIGALLALFGGLTAAKPSTTVSCSTTYGTVSHSKVPRKTSRTTTTQTATVTRKKTPTTTVTPAPVTSTDTETTVTTSTTTLDQSTDTITSTEVDTATTTSTADTLTFTEVETSTTTTTTTQTSTVATPDGFQPVSSTIPKSTGVSRVKRAAVMAERAASPEGSRPSSYPQRVSCSATVFRTTTSTTTSTAPAKTSTAPTPTSTETSTVTNTVTSTTQPGDASTTITTTSTFTSTVTTTPSTTTTSTTTLTDTLAAPSATYYAQCSNDNMADSANGQDIDFIYGNGNYFYNHAITDSYDCCAACAADGSCAVSAFDASRGFCLTVDNSGTCTPDGMMYTAALGSGPAQVVSNGNCGYIQ